MSIMHHLKTLNNSSAKGSYSPQNTDKFVGKRFPIFRSQWELKFMKWLDSNPNVIKWSSEEIQITYFDQNTKRKRQYFPDFLAVIKEKNNNLQTYLIEIKPTKDIKENTKIGKKSINSFITQKRKYINNMSKFAAAKNFCALRGWKFIILTEKQLF